MDSHVSYLSAEFIPEDGIAIAQQVARELVKWECVPQLLSRPFRGWMGRHVEVDNATPVMGQHQKYVKDLETQGRHGKEIDRDQLLEVIIQEGAPSLRGRLSAANHVFADAGFADLNAEFEQFTVDAKVRPNLGCLGSSCGSGRGLCAEPWVSRAGLDGPSTSRQDESLSDAKR